MRTYIRVGIKLLAPFRVGGWLTHEASAQTHATLRDPFDETRPSVPSSGLAGSLRSQAGAAAEALFGPPSGAALSASPWWVLGTRLSESVEIVQRGQTPISRTRRAAASRGYRTADEVLPGPDGTPDLLLYLSSEHDPEPMLTLLERWRPTVGGSLSAGMGDAEVVSIKYRTLNVTTPADLLALVDHKGAGPDRIDTLLVSGHNRAPKPKPAPLALQATVTLDDLLAAPEDREWLRTSWLHGSTWKGLLRARVEYIARCTGFPTCPQSDDDEAWTGCGECPVCAAFGSATSGQGCWTFACSDQTHDPDTVRRRSRTAIDRFTGGNRDAALFPEATMPPHQVTLTVSWGRRPTPEDGDLDGVSRALVRALGDLDEGIIGMGGRTGTGLGRATVAELELGVRPTETGEGPFPGFIDDLPAGPVDELSLMHTLSVKEVAP